MSVIPARDWIASQCWPQDKKDDALAMLEKRAEKGLKPLTMSEWSKWSIAWGLTSAEAVAITRPLI